MASTTMEKPRTATAVKRKRHSRLGSQQVVVERGRRLTKTTEDRTKFKFGSLAILIVVIGVVIAMVLSGLSTSQTMRLSEAREESRDLANQIAVLERDIAYSGSTAEIARQAGDMNLVQYEQPAILTVDAEGNLVEVRAGSSEYRRLLDINGSGNSRAEHAPTSDPAQTDNVPGMQAPAVPEQSDDPLPEAAPYLPELDRDNPPLPIPPAEDDPAPEVLAPADQAAPEILP